MDTYIEMMALLLLATVLGLLWIVIMGGIYLLYNYIKPEKDEFGNLMYRPDEDD